MPERIDLYSAYGHFTDRVLDAVRKETFGVDIGQNSWTTAAEYDRFLSWLALRSSIGLFLFVPPGINEQLIEQSGLRLLRQEDVTENAALVADRWRRARQAHQDDLRRIEGEERFEGLQRFFATVHSLTSERRLSRIAYLAEKPAGR
jgi:hypothetical protein